MLKHIIPATVIRWVNNQASISCKRVGMSLTSLPPVISVNGRYSQQKFYKDVDESLIRNHGHYVSECGGYTLDITE